MLPLRPARLALVLLAVTALPLLGQFSATSIMSPSSASAQLYFAQLADGGGWRTTLFFSNPSTNLTATANVTFYSDTGTPLPIDFGSGPHSTLQLTVPPNGVVAVTSVGAAPASVAGWAYATSDVPLVGTLMYRYAPNGVPTWDVAALATAPTYYYFSYATAGMGVAIGNPSSTVPLHVTVTARDSTGVTAGTYAVTLPVRGHKSFNLNAAIPTLPPAFSGTIIMTSTDTPLTSFLGYTLNVKDNLLAPLPPGEMQSPAPAAHVLADAAGAVRASLLTWIPIAASLGDFNTTNPAIIARYVQLAQTFTVNVTSGTTLSAGYQRIAGDTAQINISRPMLETLASSKASLAFLIAHYVMRAGITISAYNPSNVFRNDPAGAADLYALVTLLLANLDSTGMADFYGRLSTIQTIALGALTIDPAVQNEFSLINPGTRIFDVWRDLIDNGCGDPSEESEICHALQMLWYPNYPAVVP